ncbi:MAG: acyltransferase family protein [Candidatus Limnocylindrales bacterium]
MTDATAARPLDGFRPDIEGLRGIAVLLVVLFHAGLAGVIGGFIGVDVFFVISGFLITGLLVRERERTAGIDLARFYARRIRRLMPAALVALLVTLLAAMLLVAPLDRADIAADGAAAALSVANVRFALAAGDYFASVGTPSPFLHFWSLGVEEQFYLVWPALLIVAAWRGSTRRIAFALALVFVASFIANVVLTDQSVNWAFYSLPARAWQLALGGLLAVGATRVARLPVWFLAIVGWSGLAAVIAAALIFDPSLAYPGIPALLPTLGAGALLASAMSRLGPGRLLAIAPLRFVGRISYSLYLWHWPILVLAPFVLGPDLNVATEITLVALAIVVATLSWALVETPFRNGIVLSGLRPRRTLAFGLTSLLVVAVLSADIAAAADADLRSAAGVAGAEDPSATATDGTWADVTPAPLPTPQVTFASGGATPSPSLEPSPTPRPSGPIALPADVRPALSDARADRERLWQDHCIAIEPTTVPRDCVYGQTDSPFTVALVGDSHASQWFPAVERLALHEGWRVITFVKVSCPFVDMPIIDLFLKREYHECATWNAAVLDRLAASPPDLTLVSFSRYVVNAVHPGDDSVSRKAAAAARMMARVPGRVVLLADTLDGYRDVPSCLSAHLRDVRACAIDHALAYRLALGAIEKVVAATTDVPVIDLNPDICPVWPCPVVRDGMILYRDEVHLTATFAGSLAPVLLSDIAAILGQQTMLGR